MEEDNVEKKENKPTWIPLESNPNVLTDYIRRIGVSPAVSFRDCIGLTYDALSFVPQPCFALLFLFPTTQMKGEKKVEEEKIAAEGQFVSNKVYFIRQHVHNACGTIAVVHALANNKDNLNIDSGALHEFLLKTAQNTPEERGHLLGKDENMTRHHHETSKKGKTNPKDFVKADFHFICFTMVDGHLYELDGTKKYPINHGETNPQTMLHDAAKVIHEKFVSKNPGELFFSLITLGPSQGDEMIQQEIEKPRELQDEEVDRNKVEEIISMGFTPEQAIFGLKKKNNKTQQAIEYLLSNPELTSAPPVYSTGVVEVNENLVSEMVSMGFARDVVVQALVVNNNNMEKALNILLSG